MTQTGYVTTAFLFLVLVLTYFDIILLSASQCTQNLKFIRTLTQRRWLLRYNKITHQYSMQFSLVVADPEGVSGIAPPPLFFVRKFCFKKTKITHFEGETLSLKTKMNGRPPFKKFLDSSLFCFQHMYTHCFDTPVALQLNIHKTKLFTKSNDMKEEYLPRSRLNIKAHSSDVSLIV